MVDHLVVGYAQRNRIIAKPATYDELIGRIRDMFKLGDAADVALSTPQYLDWLGRWEDCELDPSAYELVIQDTAVVHCTVTEGPDTWSSPAQSPIPTDAARAVSTPPQPIPAMVSPGIPGGGHRAPKRAGKNNKKSKAAKAKGDKSSGSGTSESLFSPSSDPIAASVAKSFYRLPARPPFWDPEDPVNNGRR